MITDARVFSEEFVPSDIVYRHDEINTLSNALSPILKDGTPENVFCFGPTGAGKTCIARYTVTELQKELIDVDIQYVNCWESHTRFQLLYKILESVGRTVDIHRQGTPHDELLERIRESTDRPYVVILDEVDQLEDTDVLYDIYRIPAISMVLIANREEELFLDLEDRIHSRLKSGIRIQFDAYSTDEVTGILRDRVQSGLEPGVVTYEQLHRIADAAAGDARVAIGTLRTAAKSARQDGAGTITDEMIANAVPAAQDSIQQQTVDRLTDHQQVIYEILQDVDPDEGISAGPLYEAYEERVSNPRGRRQVRKYLAKMAHYNLVRQKGEKRGRTYHPVVEEQSA